MLILLQINCILYEATFTGMETEGWRFATESNKSLCSFRVMLNGGGGEKQPKKVTVGS